MTIEIVPLRQERCAAVERKVTHRLTAGAPCTVPHFGVALEVSEIPGHTHTRISFHRAGML